jgi:hypothetical protein
MQRRMAVEIVVGMGLCGRSVRVGQWSLRVP